MISDPQTTTNPASGWHEERREYPRYGGNVLARVIQRRPDRGRKAVQ